MENKITVPESGQIYLDENALKILSKIKTRLSGKGMSISYSDAIRELERKTKRGEK